MRTANPFEQAAGIVQSNPNGWMTREHLQKGKIGFLIGVLDDRIEIPDWLMSVNDEDQIKTAHENHSRDKSGFCETPGAAAAFSRFSFRGFLPCDGILWVTRSTHEERLLPDGTEPLRLSTIPLRFGYFQ
jgi:hypothetical protein